MVDVNSLFTNILLDPAVIFIIFNRHNKKDNPNRFFLFLAQYLCKQTRQGIVKVLGDNLIKNSLAKSIQDGMYGSTKKRLMIL